MLPVTCSQYDLNLVIKVQETDNISATTLAETVGDGQAVTSAIVTAIANAPADSPVAAVQVRSTVE